MTTGVRIDRDGDALSMTLCRPEAGNEVSGPMFEAMLEELRAEATAPRARVLVLRAEGDVFCTGRERAGRDGTTIRAEVARLIALKQAVMRSPLVTIAEVHGDAAGFGMGLAVVADFTYVAETAKLSFPEMRKGLPPAAIMAYLGRYALPKRVFPLVLLAPDFTAAYAHEIGLVTHVTTRAKLRGEVDALVEQLLALDPEAMRQCKAYFQAANAASLEDNFERATDLLTARTLQLLAK